MKRLSVVLLFYMLFACSDDNLNSDECNPENPLTMSWMKEWVAELQLCACTISIFQADYNEEPVFWQLMTDPLWQVIFEEVIIYDCAGEELLVIKTYEDLLDFQKKTSDLKIIYQCKRP